MAKSQLIRTKSGKQQVSPRLPERIDSKVKAKPRARETKGLRGRGATHLSPTDDFETFENP